MDFDSFSALTPHCGEYSRANNHGLKQTRNVDSDSRSVSSLSNYEESGSSTKFPERRYYESSTSSNRNYRKRNPQNSNFPRCRKSVTFALSTTRPKSCSDESAVAKPNKTCPTKFIGFKYLQELSTKKSHDIVCELMKSNSPIEAFLSECELKGSWLFMLMKIVKELCLSEFHTNKSEILNHICKSQLLHSISYYLGEIVVEYDPKIIEDFKSFFQNLMEFISSVVYTLPILANEKDFKKIILKTMVAIEQVNLKFNAQIEDDVVLKMKILAEKLDNHKSVLEKQLPQFRQHSYEERLGEIAPPEDFRLLSLYPTREDLLRNTFSFIRPNKIKGKYWDAEHYLDVQFRLLREDFIDPLRTGLKKYTETKSASVSETKKSKMKSKYESVRIYRRTIFEPRPVITKSNYVGYLLKFDLDRKLLKINWEYSKRFMFGSLLLFTADEFDTFFFGTVLERNVKMLDKGQVLVSLVDNMRVSDKFFRQEFLTAESEIFFEPYFLIMKSLKSIDERNFPMPRYIIHGDLNTRMPAYLARFTSWNILDHYVLLQQPDQWPTPLQLGLDDSQHEAFKNALTSEFCIIQGPPGTGKTFIGLKIVEVLLKNISLNQKAIRTPILVVCYTNHALDQFLEGVLKYTTKIVRAGSRSKSEVLRPYNLRGQSQCALRRQARDVYKAKVSVQILIEESLQSIRLLNEQKEKVELPEGVLKYRLLSNVMTPEQQRFILNDKDLMKWLFPNNERLYSPDAEELYIEIERFNNNFVAKHFQNTSSGRSFEEDDQMDDLYDDRGRIVEELFDTSNIPVIGSCYHVTVNELIEKYNNLITKYCRTMEMIQKCENEEDIYHFYNTQITLEPDIRGIMAESQQVQQLLNSANLYQRGKTEVLLGKPMSVLSKKDRWMVYWYWVELLSSTLTTQLKIAEENYRTKLLQYDEYKQMEDLYVVEKADVVGMTTTCAARLSLMLRTIKPAIVIVEEAAEVLEPHIVTSLTDACEHVIMIGDHKQLKPSAAVYQLCKKFNFDVSLFERMVTNERYSPVLNIQHRMRPEISRLITPLIYPDLKDDESVLKYEPIKGMTKNIFFLEHNEFEQEVDDTSSRKNIYEADFLIQLCRYLILQGYSPNEITILTTYIGQMFLIRERKRKNDLLKDVECIVVDKYQGEENEIILLSLVRSNSEAKIGFLKTENRICVALSRARKALYIVGNMDNLCESSQTWLEIKKILQNQEAIGNELKLYCTKHNKSIGVSMPKDFEKVSEGGCDQSCGEMMKCGHICRSMCHTLDQSHEAILCREPCEKQCKRQHPCLQLCYEKCRPCVVVSELTLPCEHSFNLSCHTDENTYQCPVILDDISSICGHEIKRMCYQKSVEVKCLIQCDARLDCGHVCPRTCHKNDDPDHLLFQCKKPCEKQNEQCSKNHKCELLCFQPCGNCYKKIDFILPCGHKHRLICSVDIDQFKCFRPCEKICPDCNTKCKRTCHESCSPCLNLVMKTVDECGHKIMVRCCVKPTRELCANPCERKAPCGHKCKALCSKPCGDRICREKVKKVGIEARCGHNFVNVLCYQQNEVHLIDIDHFLPYCDEPCNTILKCGDLCAGTCGQCWQGRLHKNCQKDCGNVLVCGHSCKYPCRRVCPPCNEPCNYRCRHSKCPKRCGVPCVKCNEKCQWSCTHFKCTRKCGDMCNRPPCNEPCTKKLEKCGHLCIGFCGEPCPPLCRLCNPEVTDIMFGYEDEPDARFVLLEDCNHIIESRAMNIYLATPPEGGEIVMKVCPLCKTPITKTLRYMNYVKTTYEHILRVKQKIFGTGNTIQQKRVQLTQKLLTLQKSYGEISRLASICGIQSTFSFLLTNLPQKVGNRSNMHRGHAEVYALCTIAENFLHIFNFLNTFINKINNKEILRKLNHRMTRLFDALLSKSKCMREDDVDFFNSEIRRTQRYCHLYIIECASEFKTMLSSDKSAYDVIVSELHKYPYSMEVDENVAKKLVEFSKITLSIAEKSNILQAMARELGGGTQQGHWYVCTCGYVYSVANCGMFNQISTCPHCRRTIGTGSANRYIDQAFWSSNTLYTIS